MRLDELRDLVRRRFPVHREVRLTELFGHPRPDHVHAEQAASATVGSSLYYHLHEALGLTDDPRPSISAVGVALDDDVVAVGARSFLGHPDEGDLWVAVDAPRHPAVVDRNCGFPEDLLDNKDPLGK